MGASKISGKARVVTIWGQIKAWQDTSVSHERYLRCVGCTLVYGMHRPIDPAIPCVLCILTGIIDSD